MEFEKDSLQILTKSCQLQIIRRGAHTVGKRMLNPPRAQAGHQTPKYQSTPM